MNPTLYDILGVSQDASRDEIRQAWREAADRFEPGEGGSTKQFRLFNEAAEVLLDPQRRQEYDEQLGLAGEGSPDTAAAGRDTGQDKAPVAEDEASKKSGPVTLQKPAESMRDESAGEKLNEKKSGTAKVEATSVAATSPGADGDDHGAPPAAASETSAGSGRAIGLPVLAALGVLAAVAVGLASYFVIQAQQAEAYQEALDRAPAAAESAATAVLSYNWESLEADRDAAAKFLTDDYREDYVNTFDKLIKDSASQTKASVEAEVLASSAMLGTPGDCEDNDGGDACTSSGERDPDRIPVLLFVNQTSTNAAASGEPSVALNRVRFDMVNVDGTWMVDGITSY